MSSTEFAVTEEEVREACKAYNVYDAGEQELAMHAALSKVLMDRRAAAALTPAAPSTAIGMRIGVYADSTPHLHVGDSAFEDWFQQQPFATRDGIKQICRDSYAAGMGDPLVTYADEGPDATEAGGFQVSVHPLSASNGVTYVVCLDGPNGERITPINRNDVNEANDEGESWAKFFRPFLSSPFVPCKAIPDDVPANTVPQYGSVVQDLTAGQGVQASNEVMRLRQALVFVAHSLRERLQPQQMLPRGISLLESNGVIVALNGWHLSIVEDGPLIPGKIFGWMIAQSIAQGRQERVPEPPRVPAGIPGWMNYSSRVGKLTVDENGHHLRERKFSIQDMRQGVAFTMPPGDYDLYAHPAGEQPAMFIPPRPAMTAAEHKSKLARVERLIALNPPVDSAEGLELAQLASEIERYEIHVYGDLSAASDAVAGKGRLFIVMNEQGSQGVIFDHRADANWTLTGEGVGSDGFSYPTLGESFRECYPDGLTLHELDAGIIAAGPAALADKPVEACTYSHQDGGSES